MFDFLFNPLARAQKRLKRLEKILLQEEVLILNPDKDKINVVKTFNKYIRKNLYKIRATFSKEAKKLASDTDNREYLKCIGISMKIDKAFNNLSIIEQQIAHHESGLRGLDDKAFMSEWLKDLRPQYDTLILYIQQIEHDLAELEAVPEAMKRLRQPAPKNMAELYLRDRRLLTKADELRKLASACGYTVIEGRKHLLVVDNRNNKITAIPRHTEINGRTAQRIMKELATAA